MKAMRAEIALSISSMKVFGFSEDKSEEQGLVMPGSANIAFAWGSTDAIEYKVPFSFFGTSSSFDQKEISIGWKVNAVQYSTHHSRANESSTGEGRHGRGGYGGGGRKGYGGTNTQQGAASMTKDESFWTRCTFK